ncbi:MAG: 50S ribosomal protein L27 [Endomicrobia bacterium]|nr:50S ribosomal protein L27 [Endomicrobiia bacterium]
MAHATNGRDSNPKYLGIKIYQNQIVKPGQIIVKQRGTRFLSGKNTYLSNDFTIHSKIEGKVNFKKYTKNKYLIEVVPGS